MLQRIEELILPSGADGKHAVEGGVVPVSSPGHLGDLGLVAKIERPKPSPPALRLGVGRVAPLAERYDVPDGVELPVLTQQVAPTQLTNRHVPYPHEESSPTRYRVRRSFLRQPADRLDMERLGEHIQWGTLHEAVTVTGQYPDVPCQRRG